MSIIYGSPLKSIPLRELGPRFWEPRTLATHNIKLSEKERTDSKPVRDVLHFLCNTTDLAYTPQVAKTSRMGLTMATNNNSKQNYSKKGESQQKVMFWGGRWFFGPWRHVMIVYTSNYLIYCDLLRTWWLRKLSTCCQDFRMERPEYFKPIRTALAF